MCKISFPTTFRDPQRLPKRRREIYLAHSAKSPKPRISTKFFLLYICLQYLKMIECISSEMEYMPKRILIVHMQSHFIISARSDVQTLYTLGVRGQNVKARRAGHTSVYVLLLSVRCRV